MSSIVLISSSWSMSPVRHRVFGFVVTLALAAGAAAPARAVELGYTGTFEIQIASLEPVVIPGSGTATVNGTGAPGHLNSLALAASPFAITAFVVPVTDPGSFPIAGVQVTAHNEAGSFQEGANFGGTMSVNGTAKVCLFGPCTAAVSNLNVPLNVVGVGGTATVMGAVNLTVVGAPWTTGTVSVGTITQMGSATPISNTGAPSGTVRLATPIFISTNIGASAVIPAFAFLGLHFVGNPPIFAQCEDGIDNDGDGRVDFPADPGCSSAEDDAEAIDARLALDTRLVEFNAVTVGGASAPQAIRLRNAGTDPLTIASITPSCPDFELFLPGFPVTIPPQGALPISARFRPTAAGLAACRVFVNGVADAQGSGEIELRGTGNVLSDVELLLLTDPVSVAQGASIPFFLTLGNRTASSQSFALAFFLLPPSGPILQLLTPVPVTLPGSASPTIEAALPTSLLLPGTYTLVAGALSPTGVVLDAAFAAFEVR